MKSLKRFITEKYENIIIDNVKVVFDVFPEEFYLNAPENYSESDIQIYIGDVFLKELPADNDKYKNLLGKNSDNINDAYFEYDKFEHINDDIKELSLKWDGHYDENNKSELNTFKLSKLKYIILFDEFEILDKNSEDVKEILNKIFLKFDSSRINKYPIDIKYNSELLEYSE